MGLEYCETEILSQAASGRPFQGQKEQRTSDEVFTGEPVQQNKVIIDLEPGTASGM